MTKFSKSSKKYFRPTFPILENALRTEQRTEKRTDGQIDKPNFIGPCRKAGAQKLLCNKTRLIKIWARFKIKTIAGKTLTGITFVKFWKSYDHGELPVSKLIFLPLHFRDNLVQQVVAQALHPGRQRSIFYIIFYKIWGFPSNFLPKP